MALDNDVPPAPTVQKDPDRAGELPRIMPDQKKKGSAVRLLTKKWESLEIKIIKCKFFFSFSFSLVIGPAFSKEKKLIRHRWRCHR